MTASDHTTVVSAPEQRPVVRSQTGAERVSYVVTVAVSDATATEVCDLVPLQNAVDVDALNALFEGQSVGRVAFRYAGCDVTVHADGRTVATPARHADG